MYCTRSTTTTDLRHPLPAINLVLSDLLVLILGLPLETYTFWSAYPWIFGETFCVVRTMAAETSTYASILTITAFTVERYVAICHPMKAKLMSSLPRAVRTIIVVWIVSGCCSVPIWIQYGVVYELDDAGQPIPDSALCSIRPDRLLEHFFEVLDDWRQLIECQKSHIQELLNER